MIRKAEEKDIATIVQYNYNMALETEEKELNREILTKGVGNIIKDSSKGMYFVYESDGKVVGQLMITKEWSDWRNGDFWWIQSVYVHQEYRRQGVFKALFEHVKAIVLADEDVCGLRLYVEKENHNAMHTYRALEMEETHYLLYEFEKKQ